MAQDDSDLQARLDRLEAELGSNAPPPVASPGGTGKARLRAQPGNPPASPGIMTTFKQIALTPLVILAIPWTQEIIDQIFFHGHWNFILYPRSLAGIPGIFLSAFSHSGFPHLIANSIGFAIFSWLILLKSRRDYWMTFLIGWLGGGLVSWLLGPTSVHGLSGVVYTLFGYLLTIGFLEKRIGSLLISVFVLINFSAVLWGVLPTQPMVAWWGHLFGLVLGVFAAYGVYREPAG